jgi:uncharacterized membrane protein YfcA
MSAALFLFLIVFGLMTGVLSALLGVGGGIFMVPALVLVGGLSQQEAQATSLLVIVPTAIVATWALQEKRIGDVRLAGKLALLGILGAAAGAAVALAISGDLLRYAFALLLVIVGGRLLWDAYGDASAGSEADTP